MGVTVAFVDPATCPLSHWVGDPDTCRWCNNPLGKRRRSWCSEACLWAFRREHDYPTARKACRDRHRGPCACHDAETPRRSQHVICAHCHRCERQVAQVMECNHRVPRLGNKASMSCMHHSSNLEMLCHDCHRAETRRQMASLGRLATPVDKILAKPARTKRDRRIRRAAYKRHLRSA